MSALLTYSKLTLIGGITGLLAGVVGGGSDAVIVPALVIFKVLSNYKLAVGTSLGMLLPPVGLFAAYTYYKDGNINFPYAFYLALMFAIGAYISSLYAVGFSENAVKKIYGVFLIFLGTYMVFYA
jgi:uncharacterized membrane protein YfcA